MSTATAPAAQIIALPEYQAYIATKNNFYAAMDRLAALKKELEAAQDAFDDAEVAVDEAQDALDQAIEKAARR